MGDKIFKKKVRMYNLDDKAPVCFSSFSVGMPSENLCVEYEKLALAFKSKLHRDLEIMLEKNNAVQRKKDMSDRVSMKDLLTKALDNAEIMGSLVAKGKVTSNLLRTEFPDLSVSDAGVLKSMVELSWRGKTAAVD